jgi:outer membrane murein-binding lipoprotein Lpp
MFGASISDLKALVDLAKAAGSTAARRTGTSAEVCHALRSIYFGPDGVLPVLKEIAAGTSVDPERLQRALTDFNDGQWNVERALSKINFSNLGKVLDLSLKNIKTLTNISYGKSQLRSQIQREINFYGQRGNKSDRELLKVLIAEIENLNAQIEELEEKINSVARG